MDWHDATTERALELLNAIGAELAGRVRGRMPVLLVRMHPAEAVLSAAAELMGTCLAELMCAERRPPLPMMRTAAAGAVAALAQTRPSLSQMADLFGKRHHSTVHEYLTKFDRDWPPVLRRLWLEAVSERCSSCSGRGAGTPSSSGS